MAVPLAWNSLRPALSPFWLLAPGLSADTLGPLRSLVTPSVAVAMSPTPPLFLLLLGLIGAQATTAVDLRTAAAMGKTDDL